MNTLEQTMLSLGQRARAASRQMMKASDQQKAKALQTIADLIDASHEELRQANAKDLAGALERNLEAPLVDRLTLSDKTLAGMSKSLRQIAGMPDPVGSMGPTQIRPNGMIDAAALCVKSGNATILRGGSEALHSNLALARIITEGLDKAGLPAEAVQLVPTSDRDAVGLLVTMTDYP